MMTPTLDPKILDCAFALEQAADNEPLAKELFEMLLAELPKLKQDLGAALEAKDKTTSGDHAHKLYGSTAYTGVPELKDAAHKMEMAIKEDDGESLVACYRAVVVAIDRILDIGEQALKLDWKD